MDFQRYQWSTCYVHEHYFLEVVRYCHGTVIVRDDLKGEPGQQYHKRYIRTDLTDEELCKVAILDMEGRN